VYTLDGGRLWVTTSRSSVKARAWRADPAVAGMVVEDSTTVTFRGRVRTYDAFDPLTWTGAVLAGPRLIEAGTRFSLKNARFFAGYAVDVRKVPLAWTPLGRVFAAVHPAQGLVLGGARDGEAGIEWGPWATGGGSGTRYRRTFGPLPRRRGLDLGVPAHVRAAVGVMGAGAIALEGDEGLTVMPVTWRRVAREGAYEATLPRAELDLAAAGPEARVALTVDHASRWRAAAMTGMLLQGTASLHTLDETGRGRSALRSHLEDDGGLALVRLVPERIVWWRGWSGGTVSAGGARPASSRRRVAAAE
jgi:hypothetical protein